MVFSARLVFTLSGVLLSTAVASAEYGTKEEHVTCSSYYSLIGSMPFVDDLSPKQAQQAFFAMLKKVTPDPMSSEAQNLVAEKLYGMQHEISKPITREGIATFREKYDATCRALLKHAWCDAYRQLDNKACAE